MTNAELDVLSMQGYDRSLGVLDGVGESVIRNLFLCK